MAKYRQAAKIDANQSEIVQELIKRGFTVETGHDDILVGKGGRTWWFEIKNPSQIKKDGDYKAGAVKPSQKKLQAEWRGHYRIVHSIDQILDEIGKADEC